MSDEVECKCPEGIPAWVMTFADLMSLLLAFFVLLFSFSEMDKAVYKELAGSLKDAFGVQREIKAKETPRGINIIAREFSPGRPQETAINEVRQMTTDESKMHPVFTDASEQGQENMDKRSDSADDKSYNAMMENLDIESTNVTLSDEELEKFNRILHDAELVREALEDEINQGVVDMEITEKSIILRIREKGSFPSGSANIIKPFEVIVDKISTVFGDFDGVIVVSGHTDNVPINTYRFRSNWELSSSRAVSVLHVLSSADALGDKRFKIAAFAETKPVASNDTWDGRANNRRVEIMMDYSETPAFKVSDTLNTDAMEAELSPEDLVTDAVVEPILQQ